MIDPYDPKLITLAYAFELQAAKAELAEALAELAKAAERVECARRLKDLTRVHNWQS